MTRRANLPGADELFRSTAPALSAVPAQVEAPTTLVPPSITTPKASSSKKGVRTIARRRVTTMDRSPSGRERHDEKITVYLSPDELFDLDQARLQLRGDLGLGVDRGRIVPLGKFATKAIEDYLVRLRPTLNAKNSKTNAAFFLNSKGGRISRQSAWNIVVAATKAAGVTEHVSPHVFRHSYATHLLDGGADIRVVQELLGHASVTTTQIYTLITIDKVRESYAMAHPRARG